MLNSYYRAQLPMHAVARDPPLFLKLMSVKLVQ